MLLARRYAAVLDEELGFVFLLRKFPRRNLKAMMYTTTPTSWNGSSGSFLGRADYGFKVSKDDMTIPNLVTRPMFSHGYCPFFAAAAVYILRYRREAA